jgi:hypothetical protein
MATTKTPGPLTRIDTYRNIAQMLSTNGVPMPAAEYAAAAVAHETADFTSRVSARDKNYSGIKFINKPYQKATKGSPAPEGGNYAHYDGGLGWAKDYSRILHLKPGEPYKANSLADFVHRLKMNKYFTDDEANYLRGATSFYNKYSKPALQREVDVQKAIKSSALDARDYYDKQAHKLAKDLDNERKWGIFKDALLTPKYLLIGAGVITAFFLIKNATE